MTLRSENPLVMGVLIAGLIKNTPINLMFNTLLNRADVVSIEVAPTAIWESILPINARDVSVCASAFAARSAPPPLLYGVGFLRELIPASSSLAVLRAPVEPWCSSPAA